MNTNSRNEKFIYVTVSIVSKAKNVSEWAVRKQCAKGRYICRMVSRENGGGRSGKSYEILLSSLPADIQEKILKDNPALLSGAKASIQTIGGGLPLISSNHNNNTAPFSFQGLTSNENLLLDTYQNGALQLGENKQGSFSLKCEKGSETSSLVSDGAQILKLNDQTDAVNKISAPFSLKKSPLEQNVIPEKAKNIALSKADLVNHWHAFRQNKKNKAEADADFVKMYNNKSLSIAIFSVLGEISIKSIQRWNKQLKENNNDYRVLIPNYNYGKETVLNTAMSEIEKSIFVDLMLKNNKISVGKAYEQAGYRLRCIGIQEQCSIKTYQRLWNYMQRNFYAQTLFAREGMKAAKDKKLPSLKRDSKLLSVGDVLVADGHVLDFNLINPFTGKPKRLTLVAFQDWASRDFVGWEIMPTENTQAIASAFRNAVLRLGKLPKVVYLDNGRAFRGKFFKGCESFCNAGIKGLYEALGIEVRFTDPYNGRSKPIERAFKELTESFSIMQETYVGNCIVNKPAYLMRNEKFHQMLKSGETPTIEDFKVNFEDWLNEIYRKRKCLNDKTKTIAEYFEAGKGEGVDAELLDEFIMVREVRTVTKDGIRLFNTYYYNPALIYVNDRVVVKYSFFDLSQIRVYSMKGQFICVAETRILLNPMSEVLGTAKDLATFKHEIKQQREIYKTSLEPMKNYLKAGAKTKKIKAKEIKNTQTEKTTALHTKRKYEMNNFPHIEQSEKKYQII